jgi:hypothetical protein
MSVPWAEFCCSEARRVLGFAAVNAECRMHLSRKERRKVGLHQKQGSPAPTAASETLFLTHRIEAITSHTYIHHLQLTCAEATQPHSLPSPVTPPPCTPSNHNGSALIAARVAADCRDVDHSYFRAPVLQHLPILSSQLTNQPSSCSRP